LAEEDWLIDSSPYVRSNPSPQSDELDYALLRVDGKPGCDTVGNKMEPDAPNRGWLQLTKTAYDFPLNSALVIVQHPQSAPLKLAIDTDSVISLNSSGTLVKYSTNTEGGSSGSPCFDINWKLVALHHSGDPNFWDPIYNAGTPIDAIVNLLEKRGLMHIFDGQC
jgi:hypothetical protein